MLLDRKKVFSIRCYIGIGANLSGVDGASPIELCERALLAVCALASGAASAVCAPTRDPVAAGYATGGHAAGNTTAHCYWSDQACPDGARIETRPTRSRWYSTAPIPASDQPRYVNGVVRIWTEADPAALLAGLQAIEQLHGRHRGEANAARTLDLDVIDAGGLVRDAPDPILPHPRADLRAFVLYPLRDVAPDWIHPRSGLSVHHLIAALPPQDIRPF